jgi:hypothetical protein
MKSFVSSYFKNSDQIEGIKDSFHEVVFIDKNNNFHDLVQKVNIPKNWFDLLSFSPEEKIEFVLNAWLEVLPFAPEYHEAILDFFGSLEDIGIVLLKEFRNSPYTLEMIYSFKEKDLFFRGQIPCDEKKIEGEFGNQLPLDYLAFFKIHSGFRRFNDLGLIRGENLLISTLKFQQRYLNSLDDIPIYQKIYNPHSLVPFYEDKNGGVMCFNIASFADDSIGDLCYVSKDFAVNKELDSFSFASFLDWLCYYLMQT